MFGAFQSNSFATGFQRSELALTGGGKPWRELELAQNKGSFAPQFEVVGKAKQLQKEQKKTANYSYNESDFAQNGSLSSQTKSQYVATNLLENFEAIDANMFAKATALVGADADDEEVFTLLAMLEVL